jgi:thioesterase domain-containing protein
LAAVMRREGWSEPWISLVPLTQQGRKPALFLVHGGGGGALIYRDLARYLGEDRPIYGLQARSLDGKQAEEGRIEEVAAHYVREIRLLQPHGPYFLGGLSVGGAIALEMAHQLRAIGEEVGLVALIDSFAPKHLALWPKAPGAARTTLYYVRDLLCRCAFHLTAISLFERGERLPYVEQKVTAAGSNAYRAVAGMAKRARMAAFPAATETHSGQMASQRSVFRDLLEAYVARPYAGRMVLFRAGVQPLEVPFDPSMGWEEVAEGGLEIEVIPGFHGEMLVEEPVVRVLAARLRAYLDTEQP